MMRYNLSGRTEITQNIIRWDAPKLLERPMLIEITGTAATDPALPEDLEKTVEGPTLTIRMDVKAAARLSRKILDLIAANGD